ncbi:histidine kinase, partial [Streptomyces chrestomyceticus]|uniref:histidine kinase n=1 Tax=Streptomyces chrestomyceticus TaxID=68185 RepID=UPI00379E7774
NDFRGGLDVLAALAPMPLAWAMGFAARTRQELLAAAERRAADARRAQALEAAQATQRERARIAGEMHDVVAHSLTRAASRKPMNGPSVRPSILSLQPGLRRIAG